jgi:hypothetical protein
MNTSQLYVDHVFLNCVSSELLDGLEDRGCTYSGPHVRQQSFEVVIFPVTRLANRVPDIKPGICYPVFVHFVPAMGSDTS